jgi:hypothetical protein
MLKAEVAITLTLNGPLLTRSSSMGQHGVDAPVARTSDGRCCVAGSLVKGRLLQAWSELLAAVGTVPGRFDPRLVEWLGEGTGDAQAYNSPNADPRRGKLYFSDFVEDSKSERGRLFRIAIDRSRGSVDEGSYQVMEAPYGSGQQILLRGVVRFLARDQAEADDIAGHLKFGLRWITNLGGERTVGFGRLKNVAVTTPNLKAPSAAQGEGVAFSFALMPESPFCIVDQRISNNLYSSGKIIPGSVVKGCLATSWRAALGKGPGDVEPGMDPNRLELCAAFPQLRITLGLPSPRTKLIRPTYPPFSRVKAGESWKDVALCAGAGLIQGHAPKFVPDWKDEDWRQTWQHFNWPDVKRELRVRTAMNPKTRRAEDKALFGYERTLPDDLAWIFEADLSRVTPAEQSTVSRQLRELLSLGLHGFGKTKASGIVQMLPASRDTAVGYPGKQKNDPWIVTLQTPALLCDPAEAGGGPDALHASYAKAWSALSGRSLHLDRFFAQQSLAGGYYLHRRFMRSDGYKPYLLTDAGSVFVLSAVDGAEEKGRQCVADWRSYGLPVPDWAEKRYALEDSGTAWKNCPYLPENGYGEIVVDLPSHWKEDAHGEFVPV